MLDWLSQHFTIVHAKVVLSGFFLVSVVIFVRGFILLNQELSGMLREVQEKLKHVKNIDLRTYDALNAVMNGSIFNHAWNEFKETIITDNDQIYNVQSFDVFLPKEKFLNEKINVSFFRKVPGILTSLGLFFTFLFIIFGLMHLQPQDSGKIEGIKELITGLSSKFQSSLWAIFLSIFFTLLDIAIFRVLEKKYHLFIDLFDSKFQKKTGEDYLRSLDLNMRELTNSMKRLSTDLSSQIQDGLSQAMRPTTDQLLIAIENLEKQKSENIADTLGQLLSEFKSSLNQSTGNEFSALANSVTKLAEILNNSAERSMLMSEKMDNLVKSLDMQVERQEKNSSLSTHKLEEGFNKLLLSIDETTKNQNENLNALLTDIVNRTSVATNGLINNVEMLAQKNSSVVTGFNGLNEGMTKSVERYQEAVQSTQSLIKSTSDLANHLASNLTKMSEVQYKIENTVHNFLEQATIVQVIQKENASSVQNYRNVFKEVESGLEVSLRNMSEHWQRYHDLTKSSLETYLNQYDDHLSKATSKLSHTVKGLDDVLDELNESLPAILEKTKS